MIRLNVFIQTAAANRDEVIRIGRELVGASLEDAGCVAYDLFESATRPEVLMICETWRDTKTLEAHTRHPHYLNLVPRLQELSEIKIEKFEF